MFICGSCRRAKSARVTSCRCRTDVGVDPNSIVISTQRVIPFTQRVIHAARHIAAYYELLQLAPHGDAGIGCRSSRALRFKSVAVQEKGVAIQEIRR